MRVVYHGPSGEWETSWPEGTVVPTKARFKGLWYTFAGTQDGAHHFREELDANAR